MRKVTVTFYNYPCLDRLLKIWNPFVAGDFRLLIWQPKFTSCVLLSQDLYNTSLSSLSPRLTFKIKLNFRSNNTESQIWTQFTVQLSAFLWHTLETFTVTENFWMQIMIFKSHGKYLLIKYILTYIEYSLLNPWSPFLLIRSWSRHR